MRVAKQPTNAQKVDALHVTISRGTQQLFKEVTVALGNHPRALAARACQPPLLQDRLPHRTGGYLQRRSHILPLGNDFFLATCRQSNQSPAQGRKVGRARCTPQCEEHHLQHCAVHCNFLREGVITLARIECILQHLHVFVGDITFHDTKTIAWGG